MFTILSLYLGHEMLNLHQRIVEIMRTMGAVGKGGQTTYGEGFAYHKIDDIDDKLRGALVQHGVVSVITEVRDRHLGHVTENDKYGNPKTVWHAECVVSIELVNADDPSDRMSIVGWGQGLDYSDKATGKATSYAAKAAYLSAFHLRGQPDNEDDNIHRPVAGKQNQSSPKETPISEEAQGWIDAINQVDCLEDFDTTNSGLLNEEQSVIDACALQYHAKKVKLWISEMDNAADIDALVAVGKRLVDEEQIVKDDLKPWYAKRQKELRK